MQLTSSYPWMETKLRYIGKMGNYGFSVLGIWYLWEGILQVYKLNQHLSGIKDRLENIQELRKHVEKNFYQNLDLISTSELLGTTFHLTK